MNRAINSLFQKSFFVTLLFSAIAGGSFAQKGTIKGKIVDALSKEPLIGVNVILGAGGVASDFDGNYTIEVDPGTVKLTYRFIGYANQVKTFNIAEGESITQNISLEESAHQFDVVVVSAGKFEQKIEDVTVSMDVIKPNLVDNKASASMSAAVNQSPGVQIVDDEPQIRGGSGYSFGAGSRVMIMVDDLPVLSGDAGRPSWSFLPIENLEQIEILKGASSVLYGSSALSGVINIRTAYPKAKPETKIQLQSGFYDTPKSAYAKSWDVNNPIFAGVNFFHSRKIGQLDLVVAGNMWSDDDFVGPEPEQVIVKKNGSKIDLSGPISRDKLTGLGGDTIYNHSGVNQGNFSRRGRVNVNLRYRPKKIKGLDYGINFNGMIRKTSATLLMLNTDSGMYRNYPNSQTRTLGQDINVDPFINYFSKNGGKHTLRSRWYRNVNNNNNNQSNESDLLYSEYQYSQKWASLGDLNSTFGLVMTSANSTSELYAGNSTGSNTNTAQNQAAYLQLDKKLWDRLTLSAGARYEQFKINDQQEGRPVFRGGLSSKLFGETYMRASWGQGFRFPTIAEKFILTDVGTVKIFPNNNLKSEKSWNAEIGLKQGWKISEFKGYLDVAAFRQEVTDAVEFNFGLFGTSDDLFNNFGFKSINMGKARIQGLDISLAGTGKIGRAEILMLAGYTYIDPKILTPDDIIENSWTLWDTVITYRNSSSDTSGILKYRFDHMFKADIQVNIGKIGIGGSFRYLSFMKNIDYAFIFLDTAVQVLPTGLAQYRADRKGKGEYVFDARLQYQINDQSRIAIVVNNVLNREYMIRPLTAEAPRTFALQYTLRIK